MDEVRRIAEKQLRWVSWSNDDERVLEVNEVAEILGPLVPLFSNYALFALIVPASGGRPEANAHSFFREVAVSSRNEGLILMPEGHHGAEKMTQFVDPFPALRALANTPVSLPAVVFWTRLGGACVLPLERARKFYREELLPVLDRGLYDLNEAIESVVPRQRIKRILHLSDLHFGQPETLSRRSWLKQELRRAISGVDRVVVTGDLFDQPRAELRETFDEFRLDVEFMTGNDLLVIPGNHDVRERGNAWGSLGRNAEQVVDLRWDPLVIDDDMRTVFFSFNSSESGDFAHGHVGERQRLDRATLFDRELNRSPKIGDYMRVALVHHHPYQYATEPSAAYERIIKKLFGKTDFTSFEGAEDFLRWCAARQVSLVLHGHKHVPHFIEADVPRPGGGEHRLTVIGCGSSTGVGERPMSYDIVTLDVDAKRSSVSFYLDEGADGGGFRLQNVALDLR